MVILKSFLVIELGGVASGEGKLDCVPFEAAMVADLFFLMTFLGKIAFECFNCSDRRVLEGNKINKSAFQLYLWSKSFLPFAVFELYHVDI